MTGKLVLPVSSSGALSQGLDSPPYGLSNRVAWATYRMACKLLQECRSRIFQYFISVGTGTESICSMQITWSIQIQGKEIHKGVNTVHRGPPKFQSTNFPSPLELWLMWTISSGKEFAKKKCRGGLMRPKNFRLWCWIEYLGCWQTLEWEGYEADVKVFIERGAAAAAAAAKSLHSCLTLRDPIDGSPPGSAVPGILQARTLEWVAISFSNAWKWKVKVKSLKSCPTLHDPMDCSLPGSSVHGIFQARVLEWGAIAFSWKKRVTS